MFPNAFVCEHFVAIREESPYVYGHGRTAYLYSKKPTSSSKTYDRMIFRSGNIDSEYSYYR